MLKTDPAQLGFEGQQLRQVTIVITSLDAQLDAAILQFESLNGLAKAALNKDRALEAIDTSFKALRRARTLIEVLGDSLPTLH